ncbi:MAG: PDZ domain-containing protein, partial [Bacteroidetes bacterium]|nr:PDZ domain-containing protein [Bacteroidota bacterium]
MKKRLKYIILFFSLLFLFSASLTTDNGKALINVLLRSLNTAHYQPLILNDEFSKRVFELYLKRLDYNKRFLTSSDVEQLRKYQYQIDDEVKIGSYELFDLSTEIIKNKLKEVEIFYKDLLSRPFDFEKDEIIELDPKKIDYAADKAALKEAWRKSLKYQTLSRLANLLQVQEKAQVTQDTTVEIKTYQLLEEEARKKVLKSHNNWFRRMSKIERSDRLTIYINAITNTYDPNTAWLPPKDKENFDIAFSGQLEGIGAQLQERDGYIRIVRIIPGSASWRQGQLKAKDIILKVGQRALEAVDVVDMRIDDAVKLIRGKKGTEVRLTVKKLDGSIIIIPIIRDVVILEETYAKSALVDRNDIAVKVGYIRLPKFYADFNKKGGRNCAEDIKKELIKLKEEDIDGIILDLRNNRGGSLDDAVKMAGLFIEKGPIVQIKSRTGKPTILRDRDPMVYYDGPLIIMVNSFSASASEILAAAMQDYKRGIIIG